MYNISTGNEGEIMGRNRLYVLRDMNTGKESTPMSYDAAIDFYDHVGGKAAGYEVILHQKMRSK